MGLVALSPAFGQRLEVVRGKVIDSQTNTPIVNASVYEERSPDGRTTTNEKGEYLLRLSAPLRRSERTKMRITAPGYRDYTKTIAGDANPEKFYSISMNPLNPKVVIRGLITYPNGVNSARSSSRVYIRECQNEPSCQTNSQANGSFELLLPSDIWTRNTQLTLVIEHPGLFTYVESFTRTQNLRSTFALQPRQLKLRLSSTNLPTGSRSSIKGFFRQGGREFTFRPVFSSSTVTQLDIPPNIDDLKPFYLRFEAEGYEPIDKYYSDIPTYGLFQQLRLDFKKILGSEPTPSPSNTNNLPADTSRPVISPLGPTPNEEEIIVQVIPTPDKNSIQKNPGQTNFTEAYIANREEQVKRELNSMKQKIALLRKRLNSIDARIKALSEKNPNLLSAEEQGELESLKKEKEVLLLDIRRLEESIARKEAELKALKASQQFLETQNQKLARTNKQLWISILAVSLLTIISIALFILYFNWERKARRAKAQADNTILELQRTRNALAHNLEELSAKNKEILRKAEELMEERTITEELSEEVRTQHDHLRLKEKELEEVQEARESLVAMIVHDLKNPLNHIQAYSNPEATQKPLSEIVKGLNIIYQAGRRIDQMSTNILQIQKYEGRNIPLDCKDYNLYQLSQEAVSQVKIYLGQKGIRLENRIPRNLWANFDRECIFRVFDNLLSNAIKYTDAGDCITLAAEEVGHWVRIEVSDTGKGISEEKMKTIFDKFVQDEAKTLTRSSSVGLGLTFCKMALESHQSKIEVESSLNHGSTFRFYLHLSDLDEPVASDDASIVGGREIITLHPHEKAILKPLVEEILSKNIKYRNASKIEALMQDLAPDLNGNVKTWREAMLECAQNPDETRFKELIDCVIS
ncbi:MAG: hypothetical protein OHK0053_37520 [Microscillaceae bacterium]